MSAAAEQAAGSSPEPNVYAGFDWDTYSQYRPAYPRSLIDLIVQHHGPSARKRLAHDVGSGNGIFASLLSPHFTHIHVSDPAPSNISHARTALETLPSTFTFSATPAESLDSLTLPHTVDLITLAACAHWTDIDTTVHRAAHALRPGGTLAIICYTTTFHIIDNPDVDRLWTSMHAELLTLALKIPSAVEGSRKLYLGHEFIPLPEELFDSARTKRISLNTYGKGTGFFRLSAEEELFAPSRARDDEARYEYSFPEAEARGWRFGVGPGWFRGYLATFPLNPELTERVEARLREVDDVIRGVPGEEVTVEFPAWVLLATRR